MKFNEFDNVKIMKDCEDGVKKGDIGAIVMCFNEPNEAYEVEIVDQTGNTRAVITLLPNDIELV